MNKKLFGTLLMGSLLMGGTFVSCQDYDDDIKNLQSQIDGLKGLQSSIDQVKSDLSAAQSSTQANITSAVNALKDGDVKKALADAADAAAKASAAATTATDATAAAKAAQEAADAAKTLAEAAQKAADGNVLSEDDAKQIAWIKENAEKLATVSALSKSAEDLKKEVEAKINGKADATAVAELTKKIEALQAAVGDVTGKRLTSLVFAPETYIDGIETINFATFTYADWGTAKTNWLRDEAGLYQLNEKNEMIEVAKDAKGAIKVGDKYYAPIVKNIIGDNSTTAQYLVSPAGVKLEGIKELTYLAQDEATNSTRAIKAAPIKVVSKSLDKGILTLKLAKTDVSNAFGDGKEEWSNKKFTVVSLKATLADAVLTAAEKDAEVNVFSDWTRITESTVTPYIANTQARDEKGNLVCGYYDGNWGPTYNSHFWDFTTIYHRADAKTGDRVGQVYDKTGVANKYGEYSAKPSAYIAKQQIYSEPLDLLSLVTVCAGNTKNNYNEVKNYADYGLKFEFSLMDKFIVKNENGTQDNTDQQQFAKLTEGHILTACSEDGQLKNADAVGRTPVVQVRLVDANNNNAVVDVRYFKILWTAEAPMTVLWKPATDLAADGYKCTGLYETYILEQYMNSMYANIVDGGVTKEKFHSNKYIYDAYANVAPMNYNEWMTFYAYTYTENYGTKDAKTTTYTKEQIEELLKTNNFSNELKKLAFGQAVDMYDSYSSNQTHNIKINVKANDYRLPQTEKDFTIEGFFFFYSYDTSSFVIIPVTFDVKKGTLINKYNYLETQWQGLTGDAEKDRANADKVRPANPTLISDKTLGGTYKGTTYNAYKTTQLISDITYGYMAKSQTPVDFHDLAVYKSATSKETDPFKMAAAASDVVFDADRLAILPAIAEGTDIKNVKDQTYKWAVTKDGKTLYVARYDAKGAEVAGSAIEAAKIDAAGSGDKRVYLCDTKTATNNTFGADKATSVPTEAALLLVGQKVPVKVTATNCNKVDFDKYLIWFIDPLKWSEGSQAITLKDVLNEGDAKEITLGGQFTLQENFGSKTPLYLFDVYDSKGKLVNPVTTELNEWYGIENVAMDKKANWLINLNANGAIVDNSSAKMVNFVKGGTTELIYDLDLLDATKTPTTDITKVKYVKFHNNSGQAITKNIVIKVPVSLDTKWKKGNKNYITVTITPNI